MFALLLMLVQFSWQNILVSASPAPSAIISQWTLPNAASSPYGVVVYAGKVYFTEEKGRIGCLNPSENSLKEWVVPTISPTPERIAIYGSQIWFTENGANKIGRLALSTNTFTEWSLPSGSLPYGIAVYGDKVYFTEQGRNKIGRIDPSVPTKITEWNTMGLSTEHPLDITTDASGNLWFTDFKRKAYRLTPSTGALRTWTLPDSPSYPAHITVSKDGMVWFTEYFARDRIGRLNPSRNKLTEWGVPTPTHAWSFDIVEDAMGNIFFTENQDNQIGKLKPVGGTTRTTEFTQVTVTPSSYTTYPVNKYVKPTIKYVSPSSTTVPSSVSGSITEWKVPTASSKPAGISTEDGTTFYFTESAGNKIARIRPAYTITQWSISLGISQSRWLRNVEVYGGMVWFTEEGWSAIGRLDPLKNAVTEWKIPNPTGVSQPLGIVVYNGMVWFTEWSRDKIGRLDPATNTLTEWTMPTSVSYPWDVAVYGGMVWFTEEYRDSIGRLDPATNLFREWKLPWDGSSPWGVGPYGIVVYNGMVWFTESHQNKIGRLDPSTNKLTEWKIPTSSGGPFGPWDIVVYGGMVWFIEAGANKIGVLDPYANRFTEWTIPTGSSWPWGIAVYGGKAWFTERDANKIGKLYRSGGSVHTVAPVSTIVSPLGHLARAKTSQTLAPTTSAVVPKKTDVFGSTTEPFTEWLIPAPTYYQAMPEGVAAAGGGEVWFAELGAHENNIGLLS